MTKIVPFCKHCQDSKDLFFSITEASQAIQSGAVGVLEVSSLGSAFWFQRYL
jgi:hypothetical protein